MDPAVENAPAPHRGVGTARASSQPNLIQKTRIDPKCAPLRMHASALLLISINMLDPRRSVLAAFPVRDVTSHRAPGGATK